jgi:hypothetical protein
MRGVTYSEDVSLWRASWTVSDGESKARVVIKWFSVAKLGFAEAKRQAVAARTEAVANGASVMRYKKDCVVPADPKQLKSTVMGVSWARTNKAWYVHWKDVDTDKRTCMTFSAVKHGFEGAKSMAEQFRKDLEQNALVTKVRPDGSRPVVAKNMDAADFEPSAADLKTIPGVTYDSVRKFWKARWTRPDGDRQNKTWDVRVYGFHGAKKLAEEARAAEVEAGARVNLSTKVDMAFEPAKYQSSVTGVSWNEHTK